MGRLHIALAGHFHRTYAESARKMVETAGAALVTQAATATSTRLRNNEPHSFNRLHANGRRDIELQVVLWFSRIISPSAQYSTAISAADGSCRNRTRARLR